MGATTKRKLRPFDFGAHGVDMSAYDRIKYVRDVKLCPVSSIALWTGNFIHFFNFNEDTPYILKDMDALAQIKIEEHLAAEKEKKEAEKPVSILESEPGLDEEAMEEKLDRLLMDTDMDDVDDTMDFSAFDDTSADFF